MCGKLYLNLFQKMNQLEKKWQRSKISQAVPPKKNTAENEMVGKEGPIRLPIGFR